MSRALRFNSLTIRRAPGFLDGGPVLRDLHPGVSLILGPNESGKSTVARMLQGMLWPELLSAHYGDARIDAEATLEHDGASWRVVVDGPRVRWQKNGADHPGGPVLPTVEHARRYHLSLHDLLAADDAGRGLAAEIRRLAAGGFDFAAAADRLAVAASGRPRSLVQELHAARGEVSRARAEAKSILDEAKELGGMERRLRELDASAALLPALERLQKLEEARSGLSAAGRDLEGFPAGMEVLRDGDAELWNRLRERRERLQTRLSELEQEAQEATRSMTEMELGEAPPDEAVLERLGILADDARGAHRELEESRRGLAAAEEGRRSAAGALGLPPELAPAGGWPADALPRLVGLLRTGAGIEARITQTRARLEALAGGTGAESAGADGGGESADRLQARRELLMRWLAAPAHGAAAASFPRGPLLIAGVVLLVAGVGLVWSGLVRSAEPDALVIGAGLLVAVAGLGLALLRPPAVPDERARVQGEIQRAGGAPPTWTEDGVRTLLDEVEGRLTAAREARLRGERLREVRAQLDEAEAERERWRKEYDELVAALGLSAEADPLTVERVGAALVRWDAAVVAVDEAAGAVQAREAALAAALEEARDLLAPWNAQPETVAELRATEADLARRARSWAEARARKHRARRDADGVRDELGALASERADFAGRCGVPEAELADFLGPRLPELDAWRRAREAEKQEQVRVRQMADDVDADRERHGEGLAGLLDGDGRVADATELERLQAKARSARQEADELRERIGSVRRSLADARRRHDLEEALARETEAVAALARWRDEERQKAVTRTLVDWVRTRTEERDRPRVFERARRIMERITQGRHSIALAAADQGGFRAVRSDTGEGLGLEQLSSGTRVQLLLAVRLAFVEVQEGEGPALPLLLDEVLGTSDDERARVIVHAANALAADGRQLIYFTAQADEIRKWQQAAREEHAPDDAAPRAALPPVVTLGRTRVVEPALPWPEPQELVTSPPPPDGRDHADYGRHLGVPPLALWAPQPVQALHPWHLLDDPGAIHRLLETGLDRWGRVETFVRPGDPGIADDLHALRAAMAPRARVCADLVELARQGRGRPVDREVLEASGAVSEVFIERATALAERLAGDAASLVRAIDAGELKGFRSDKADDLRAWLTESGHLPDEEPLQPEELLTTLHLRAQRLAEPPEREVLAHWISRWLQGP